MLVHIVLISLHPADLQWGNKSFKPSLLNPAGGYGAAPVVGSLLAVCSFNTDKQLTSLKLYPVTRTKEPRSQSGIPMLADAETAQSLIEYFAELSSDYGTKIEYRDGIGLVEL